jgi:hypothetical protein
MKKAYLLALLVIFSISHAFAQPKFTYKIKADSVLITNDSCEAELIVENHTKNVTNGFLVNRWNGRTEFRKALVKVNDSLYLIGGDSLKLSGLSGNYIANQNASQQTANYYISGTGSLMGGISVGAQFNTTNTSPSFYNSYKAQIWDSLLVEGTGVSQVRFTGNNAFNPGFVFNGSTSNTKLYTLNSQNLSTSTNGGTYFNNNKVIFNNSAFVEAFQQPITIRKTYPATSTHSTLILDNDTVGMALSGLTKANYKIITNKFADTIVSYFTGNGGGVFTEDLTVNGITVGDGKGTGIQNTALGNESLSVNTTGEQNTAAGYHALKRNTTGKYNAAFGRSSLSFNTTGDINAALGYNALQLSTTGGGNTAVGGYSMQLSTTGSVNTAVGWNSLGGNTSGNYNTAVGKDACRDNAAGEFNNGFGYAALNFNTASGNNGFGTYAVYSNTTGTQNAGFGNSSLYFTTTGINNAAFGGSALYNNTTGSNNAAFGLGALFGALGFTGSNNTAIGVLAGQTLSTGSNNIFIGYNVSPNIGITASNQLNIGGWIYGDNGKIGIGVTGPTAKLNLSAGTTSANTAPLKFTSGTNLTTPENGAVEYDGTNYFATSSSTRYTIAKTLTTTASLNFSSTSAQSSADLTITVTGAADGDAVNLGIPNASVNNNSCYTAWVSAANTVTVRFNNYSSGSVDPASGTFRVSVMKY